MVEAVHDFGAVDEDKISFKRGDFIIVSSADTNAPWWIGKSNNMVGEFPSVAVEPSPIAKYGDEGIIRMMASEDIDVHRNNICYL